ncbi:MAG: hypothetical protein IJJ23_08160 [Clostridia bacterium]|nr:hypothetical protein [Clostridia bacterium]
MSMLNQNSAFQTVLSRVMDERDDVVLVLPSDAAPRAGRQRIVLPPDARDSFLFAQGCAQAGLFPVLDLTGLGDAAEALYGVLSQTPARLLRPMAVRISARRFQNMPGIRVIPTHDARQSAGALRCALEREQFTVIAADPLTAFDLMDVDEDEPYIYDGSGDEAVETAEPDVAERDETEKYEIPDPPADGEPAPDEAFREEDVIISMDAPDIDASDAPNPFETTAQPEPLPASDDEKADDAETPPPAEMPPRDEAPVWAYAILPYDPEALLDAAEKLDMPASALAELCARLAMDECELIVDTDSPEGACDFERPKTEPALLYVGMDRLALTRDENVISRREGFDLMSGVRSRLEQPLRLIADYRDLIENPTHTDRQKERKFETTD